MYPEWTRNTYPVVLTSTAKSNFALYYLFRLAFILHCTRDNRSRVTLNRCILSTDLSSPLGKPTPAQALTCLGEGKVAVCVE